MKKDDDMKKPPAKRCTHAQALANPLFRKRVVKDKTKYNRKNQDKAYEN